MIHINSLLGHKWFSAHNSNIYAVKNHLFDCKCLYQSSISIIFSNLNHYWPPIVCLSIIYGNWYLKQISDHYFTMNLGLYRMLDVWQQTILELRRNNSFCSVAIKTVRDRRSIFILRSLTLKFCTNITNLGAGDWLLSH